LVWGAIKSKEIATYPHVNINTREGKEFYQKKTKANTFLTRSPEEKKGKGEGSTRGHRQRRRKGRTGGVRESKGIRGHKPHRSIHALGQKGRARDGGLYSCKTVGAWPMGASRGIVRHQAASRAMWAPGKPGERPRSMIIKEQSNVVGGQGRQEVHLDGEVGQNLQKFPGRHVKKSEISGVNLKSRRGRVTWGGK